MPRTRSRRIGNLGVVSALESRKLLAAVNVTSTPGPRGATNLVFEGSAANDWVQILTDPATRQVIVSDRTDGLASGYGTTFRLNGGAEVSQLFFSKLGNLSFKLGAGDDAVTIRDTSAGDVTIQDGVAASEGGYYAIQNEGRNVKLGNIQAHFERGGATLVLNRSQGSMSVGQVAVTGSSEVRDVRLLVADGSGSGRMTIQGLVSLDLPENAIGSSQLRFASNSSGMKLLNGIRHTGGAGSDEFHTSGILKIRGDVQITTHDGGDSVAMGGVDINGEVRIDTGAGADGVGFFHAVGQDPEAISRFRKDVTITTGSENDAVLIRQVAFAQALTIDTGTSEFTEFEITNWVTLIDMEVRGTTRISSSQRMNVYMVAEEKSEVRFGGPAEFVLGSGQLDIESANANIYFDDTHRFEGVDSQILVNYSGNVIADPAKRTLVNAVLWAP